MTENVLGAIKSGEAKMRPRWHFVMRAALIMIGGIIVFLFTVYLVSFLCISFGKRAFGLRRRWFRGWRSFFISFPWILFIFSVIFAVILGILVKRYALSIAIHSYIFWPVFSFCRCDEPFGCADIVP